MPRGKTYTLAGYKHSKHLARKRAHRHRNLIIAMLLLAVAGSYLTVNSRAATPAPAPPPEPLKIQPGMAADISWGVSKNVIDKEVALMKSAGVKWTRVFASWAVGEPKRGSYNWDLSEYAVKSSHAAGINSLVVISQTPKWATSDKGQYNFEHPPKPAYYKEFAKFAGATVQHYKKQGVKYYEIWNEQNKDRFWPGHSAAEYTKLLKLTYAAIKEADPEAQVLFGGMAGSDHRYLETAYSFGAKDYFDVVAVHPYYGSSPPPDSGSIKRQGSFGSYRGIRQLMIRHGDSHKKIWITEIGWSTCTTDKWCVSKAQQADYLTRAYRFANQDAAYLPVVFWYNFRDNFWEYGADNWEARLGLMDDAFRFKPAYSAYKALFNP